MRLYEKHILPRLTHLAMGQDQLLPYGLRSRASVLSMPFADGMLDIDYFPVTFSSRWLRSGLFCAERKLSQNSRTAPQKIATSARLKDGQWYVP